MSRLRTAAGLWRRDARARAGALLYAGFAANAAYALINAIGGIAQRSVWLGTLAFYYLVLGAIRLDLLRGYRQQSQAVKRKKYRQCAVMMLLLTLALLGIALATTAAGHTIAYPGYLIYAIAAYTFFSVGNAIRNVIVYRRYDDPVLLAAKALNLAAAAISVYCLQSALISAFGEDGPFRRTMDICVGAAVLIIIVGICAAMLAADRKAGGR